MASEQSNTTRGAGEDLDASTAMIYEPTTATVSSTSPNIPMVDLRRGNPMPWYNALVKEKELRPVLRNLVQKISRVEFQDRFGCLFVEGIDNNTCIEVDAQYQHLLPEDFPKDFSPYIIAMAHDCQLIPSRPPPDVPHYIREGIDEACAAEEGFAEEDPTVWHATWVASHLCDEGQRCVNPDHLTFEPDWFVEDRANCSGFEFCIHRPRPCIATYQYEKLCNWHDYKEIPNFSFTSDMQAEEESQLQQLPKLQQALEDLEMGD